MGRTLLPALLVGGCLFVISRLQPLRSGSPAWLVPTGTGSASSSGSDVEEGQQLGRRHLWGAGLSVAAVAALSEPADAFRTDRLLNAKSRYVPRIRKAYQKLEGLRDDIYIEFEFEDKSDRFLAEARVADWYDGVDRKMTGQLALPTDEDGFGCGEYMSPVTGMVVLVPRGRCYFKQKIVQAQKAGAKAVVVWDERMSNMDFATQNKKGMTRSKGIATRKAGDALSGGVAIVAKENGVTIMAPNDGNPPPLDAVMINLANGTAVRDFLKDGGKPRITDVERFDFTSNIDRFIKKDLKNMLEDMKVFGMSMRMSKDDVNDPIIGILDKCQKDFEAAVRSKDYGKIRSTFDAWNKELDPLGQWTLSETF